MPQIAQQDYIKLPFPADTSSLTDEEKALIWKYLKGGSILDCVFVSEDGKSASRIVGYSYDETEFNLSVANAGSGSIIILSSAGAA